MTASTQYVVWYKIRDQCGHIDRITKLHFQASAWVANSEETATTGEYKEPMGNLLPGKTKLKNALEKILNPGCSDNSEIDLPGEYIQEFQRQVFLVPPVRRALTHFLI